MQKRWEYNMYKDLTSLVEQTQFDFNNIQYNDIKTPIVTIKELETIKEVNEIITTRVLIKKDKIKTISKEAK